MTKKDYEKAASIAQQVGRDDVLRVGQFGAVVDAFVELFVDDNDRFDEMRFRRACVPGANVRSRKVA